MALKIVTLIGLLTTVSRYVGRPHANWLPCLLIKPRRQCVADGLLDA